MKPHQTNADGPSAECDRPLGSFDLTDRQARCLVTVMRHAGVFVGRQYAAFAGVTHGQKVHGFIQALLVRRFATSIELGTTGRDDGPRVGSAPSTIRPPQKRRDSVSGDVDVFP